jgi:hypothetical protein
MNELKAKMKESGYNSENENSTELLKLYPTDKNINHSEIEDMKNILAKARDREAAAIKKGVYKEPEVSNYYKVVKATP